MKVVAIRIFGFLSGCILALLKAIYSLPKKELDVNKSNLLMGTRLYSALGLIRRQVCSILDQLIGKVYLLCQHSSSCSEAPITPKNYASIIYQGLAMRYDSSM